LALYFTTQSNIIAAVEQQLTSYAAVELVVGEGTSTPSLIKQTAFKLFSMEIG
jgi:hypothetical protein